jgi:hypothetical protein
VELPKKIINTILFLTRDSNFEIPNRTPSKYLAQVQEKYPGELEKQFIPTEPALWEIDRYEDFMIKRRELIAKGINQLMNDLITGKPKNEPQNLDGYLIPGENELVEFKSTLR